MMKISNSEKLIIALLDNISKHLNIDKDSENISSRFVMDAIYSGNEWAIASENHHLFDSSDKYRPPHVQEVYNFLYMWRIIEESYEKLSEEDKKKVKEQNFNIAPSFEGFDWNHETEYLSATMFMVEKMTNCFPFLGERCKINSHSPKVPKYQAMYDTFQCFLHSHTRSLREYFTAEQMIEIIKSR